MSRVAGSATIATFEIAAAALPDGEYNLMTLPKNFLKLSETVTYLKTADNQVLDLVTYLENTL
ncbi:hypothetical protein [Secundilactobacillus silagei]|uniref:hypothetical protein n=1 Tax=Secundilactobacillus silagei TaxID=1293415 RepID=UPI0006CF7C43|nr:hypothetical protein [Secundilactobacillus silagei]